MYLDLSSKTKILATIGPASSDNKILKKLIKSGVNAFRLNFSHGNTDLLQEYLNNIRKAAKETGKQVAVLQDLSGPKIRTGDFKDGEYILRPKKEVVLTIKKPKNPLDIFINYPNLPKDVKKGDRILLNDGKQVLKVISVGKDKVVCKVIIGGKIKSRRGVNLPDSKLSIPSFTNKDKKDVDFAIKNNIDFIALSFVQTHKDILQLRRYLNKHNSNAKIIAKIETNHAVEDIDNIIKYSDGIMVARGDLAVEVGASKVPMLQKQIIKKANNSGKLAIVATQMLETMINEQTPTRAEISDIANAILDGADTLMLSAETAIGKYPVDSVCVMKEAIISTEKDMDYTKRLNKPYATSKSNKINELTSRHAAKLASELDADYIVSFTETGYTYQSVSKYRVKQNILVLSQNKDTLVQANMYFGVFPLDLVTLTNNTDILRIVKDTFKKHGIYKKDTKVVIIAGTIFGQPGGTNTIITIKLD